MSLYFYLRSLSVSSIHKFHISRVFKIKLLSTQKYHKYTKTCQAIVLKMILDCTSSTMNAACAEAVELFLQAAPHVDEKWQMQRAADLLFFTAASIFVLLISLHFIAHDNNAVRGDGFPIPISGWLAFEMYLIIQVWALDVKAGITVALLVSLKYLYKFVTTRRAQQHPDQGIGPELFKSIVQQFWRPILVCLMFVNWYGHYAESNHVAASGECPFRDFVQIALWCDWNDGNGNWWLSVCGSLTGLLVIIYFCFDPDMILREAFQVLTEDAWEEIEGRAMRYVHGIERIINRVRGIEATDEVVVRMGEHLQDFRELGFRNLLI